MKTNKRTLFHITFNAFVCMNWTSVFVCVCVYLFIKYALNVSLTNEAGKKRENNKNTKTKTQNFDRPTN